MKNTGPERSTILIGIGLLVIFALGGTLVVTDLLDRNSSPTVSQPQTQETAAPSADDEPDFEPKTDYLSLDEFKALSTLLILEEYLGEEGSTSLAEIQQAVEDDETLLQRRTSDYPEDLAEVTSDVKEEVADSLGDTFVGFFYVEDFADGQAPESEDTITLTGTIELVDGDTIFGPVYAVNNATSGDESFAPAYFIAGIDTNRAIIDNELVGTEIDLEVQVVFVSDEVNVVIFNPTDGFSLVE